MTNLINYSLSVLGVLGVLAVQSESPPSRLADIGPAPEVALVDVQGRPFRLSDLRGKAVVVSFIYTTCNGTCPATTRELVRARKALEQAGLWGTRAEFVSISLDPERDTPEVLARYAKQQGADADAWHFLTGPAPRVGKVLASWDMWARRDASGVLDHPSRVFLIDPRGRRREIYNLDFLTPRAILEDVKAVLDESDRTAESPKATTKP
jgi:protein SCO1/2